MSISFYLVLVLLFGLVVLFIGWRSVQYKAAQKRKRAAEDPRFHPAFYNPNRTKRGASYS